MEIGSNENLLSAVVYKGKIFQKKSYLSLDPPPKIVGRNDQIAAIIKYIQPIFCDDAHNPPNILISGPTGCGKTLVVSHVLDTYRNLLEDRGYLIVKLNCANQTSTGIFRALILAIEPHAIGQRKSLGLCKGEYISFIAELMHQHKKNIIFFMDEIDKIRASEQDTLYSLIRFNAQSVNLAVIMVTNNFGFFGQLDARIRSSLSDPGLTFFAYSAHDLEAILMSRLPAFTDGAISPYIIKYIAAVGASQCDGDARKTLTLLTRAGDVADDRGATSITEEDVNIALERMFTSQRVNGVKAMSPAHQVALLSIILAIKRKATPMDELVHVRIQETYKVLKQLQQLRDVSDKKMYKSATRHSSYVTDLETFGLLEIEYINYGRGRGRTREISILLSPPEIDLVYRYIVARIFGKDRPKWMDAVLLIDVTHPFVEV